MMTDRGPVLMLLPLFFLPACCGNPPAASLDDPASISALIAGSLPVPSRLTLRSDPEARTTLLRWRPVEGATGYEVYRADAETGPWRRIATVRDDEFTDTGIEPRRDSYYSVVATDDGGRVSGGAGPLKGRLHRPGCPQYDNYHPPGAGPVPSGAGCDQCGIKPPERPLPPAYLLLPAPDWLPGQPRLAGGFLVAIWGKVEGAKGYVLYRDGKKAREGAGTGFLAPAPAQAGPVRLEVAAVDAAGVEGVHSPVWAATILRDR